MSLIHKHIQHTIWKRESAWPTSEDMKMKVDKKFLNIIIKCAQ